jgi:hypothetical protein
MLERHQPGIHLAFAFLRYLPAEGYFLGPRQCHRGGANGCPCDGTTGAENEHARRHGFANDIATRQE